MMIKTAVQLAGYCFCFFFLALKGVKKRFLYSFKRTGFDG